MTRAEEYKRLIEVRVRVSSDGKTLTLVAAQSVRTPRKNTLASVPGTRLFAAAGRLETATKGQAPMRMFKAVITASRGSTKEATLAVQEYLDTLPAEALRWQQNRSAELNGKDYDRLAAKLWCKTEEQCVAVALLFCTHGSKRGAESVTLEITPLKG